MKLSAKEAIAILAIKDINETRTVWNRGEIGLGPLIARAIGLWCFAAFLLGLPYSLVKGLGERVKEIPWMDFSGPIGQGIVLSYKPLMLIWTLILLGWTGLAICHRNRNIPKFMLNWEGMLALWAFLCMVGIHFTLLIFIPVQGPYFKSLVTILLSLILIITLLMAIKNGAREFFIKGLVEDVRRSESLLGKALVLGYFVSLLIAFFRPVARLEIKKGVFFFLIVPLCLIVWQRLLYWLGNYQTKVLLGHYYIYQYSEEFRKSLNVALEDWYGRKSRQGK